MKKLLTEDDYKYGFDGLTPERMKFKMAKGWRSNETPCGRGSELAMTSLIRTLLPRLVEDYEIKSIADAGCGDLNWIEDVTWRTPVLHKGFDLVPRHRDVTEFDLTTEILPKVDLILCRHVLNHLSPRLSMDVLDNFVKSGSTYLLFSNCHNLVHYWTTFGLKLRTPFDTWSDTTKWTLGIHRLQEPNIYTRFARTHST